MANKFNFTLFIELLTNYNADMFIQDNNTQASLF